jgi:hypothetical protein
MTVPASIRRSVVAVAVTGMCAGGAALGAASSAVAAPAAGTVRTAVVQQDKSCTWEKGHWESTWVKGHWTKTWYPTRHADHSYRHPGYFDRPGHRHPGYWVHRGDVDRGHWEWSMRSGHWEHMWVAGHWECRG